MRRALVLTLTLLVVDGCGPGPTSESPKAPVVVAVNDASAPSPEPTRAPEPAGAGGNEREEPRGSGDHAADGHDQLERGLHGDAGPDEDPAHGNFTLADATAGLAGSGPLVATIKTSKGDLKCKLYDDKAPITAANFVGLARGTRPWKDPSGAWVKRPAYDGTRFHRVIPGFMIQGGDPRGDGTGEPGYVIPDERWPGAKHDRAGLLCAANRGANTNGMQFFVTDAKTPHLDNPGNAYTIFGECQPTSVVSAIANEKRDARDRPLADVIITTVEIARLHPGAGAAAPSLSGRRGRPQDVGQPAPTKP